MPVMRSASSWIASTSSPSRCASRAAAAASPACAAARPFASIDEKPTIVVSGVRRSCEIADSSELRSRSDSMLTSASRAIST